jgi:hypothetical protein
MVLAWLKLRRRNISQLLNANGWAGNASSKISIPFGATLTDMAKFPKMKLKDPFAKKPMAAWKKWLISLVCLGVVFAGLWLFNKLDRFGLPSPLDRYKQTEEVVQDEEAVSGEVTEAAADADADAGAGADVTETPAA